MSAPVTFNQFRAVAMSVIRPEADIWTASLYECTP